MNLTGLKDTDREVLKYVDDKELLKVCSVDRRFWNEVCDDNFLRRRLNKYPGIEKYRKANESLRNFFLRVVYRIAKMKEFEFDYSGGGDFEKQYLLLQKSPNISILLIEASKARDLSLVKYAIEKEANIHVLEDEALYYAAENGDISIVKYLVEKGADFKTYNRVLLSAASAGHLDVVKYLVENWAPLNRGALKWAAKYGYLNIVKYLVEKGSHIDRDIITTAKIYRHTDIAKYLLEKRNKI
jgi:hypothetical protein